jgi:hypothetical protein
MRDRNAAVNAACLSSLARLAGWEGALRRSVLVNLFWPLSIRSSFPEGSKYGRYVERSLGLSSLLAAFEDNPGSDATVQMERLLDTHLDEIVSLCRERGVPLFLGANPWEYQASAQPRSALAKGPYPRENRLEQIIGARYSNAPGVHILPMTAAFRKEPDPASCFMDRPEGEIHWNAAGHELVERIVRQTLSDNGVLHGAP